MTITSGALDKSVVDGNTILLVISEENNENKHVYIAGNMICSSPPNDNVYKYISNIGINLNPYSIAIGDQNIYFLNPYFKFIIKEKINNNELLKTTAKSVNPFDYRLEKQGLDCFKNLLEFTGIHSSWPEDVIDELKYTVGSNKIVKMFYQKSVICLERDSDNTFKQCGHQCICDHCYQNKGNFDIKKSLVCRT